MSFVSCIRDFRNKICIYAAVLRIARSCLPTTAFRTFLRLLQAKSVVVAAWCRLLDSTYAEDLRRETKSVRLDSLRLSLTSRSCCPSILLRSVCSVPCLRNRYDRQRLLLATPQQVANARPPVAVFGHSTSGQRRVMISSMYVPRTVPQYSEIVEHLSDSGLRGWIQIRREDV